VPDPVGGAGVASGDPDQSTISQDPQMVVVGDLDQVPEIEPLTLLRVVNDVVDAVPDGGDQ